MSSTELKEWMDLKEWRPLHVAAATDLSEATVKRFLKGDDVRPVVRNALKRLVKENPILQPSSNQMLEKS